MGRGAGGLGRAPLGVLEETYDQFLSLSGLTEPQINALDLAGLHEALARVNDAIARPDQFPKINFAVHGGKIASIVAERPDEGAMGVLPLLLHRKRLILERITELRSQEKIGGLRELIDRIPDEETKQALSERLAALEVAASEAEHLDRDAAAQQSELEFRRERELAELRMQLSERRWRLRSAQLARESVAPMVGAALLVGLAITLIIAMFAKVEVSALISNSFLIILGYFFGQSSEPRSRRQVNGDRDDT